MDVNGVEQVNVAALGGADTLTVNDLSGTGVTGVNLDLAGTPGSGTGDGQADTVIVNGTAHADAIQITGSGTSYTVAGLPAIVAVQGSEGANDQLVVNALGGNDIGDRRRPACRRGRADRGRRRGQRHHHRQRRQRHADRRRRQRHHHRRPRQRRGLPAAPATTRSCGTPATAATWSRARAAHDTLQFNGSNANENIDLSANGSRLRLFRDVGNVTMDVNGVEQVNVAALGGADTLTVNDLSGTGVTAREPRPRRHARQRHRRRPGRHRHRQRHGCRGLHHDLRRGQHRGRGWPVRHSACHPCGRRERQPSRQRAGRQ